MGIVRIIELYVRCLIYNFNTSNKMYPQLFFILKRKY
jgi:hypothetical protein